MRRKCDSRTKGRYVVTRDLRECRGGTARFGMVKRDHSSEKKGEGVGKSYILHQRRIKKLCLRSQESTPSEQRKLFDLRKQQVARLTRGSMRLLLLLKKNSSVRLFE